TFVTESTFGLPIYRWRAQAELFEQINAWWRSNQEKGKASLLFAYALGKAQRVLAGVDPAIGPIYTHGAVERLTGIYRDEGISLPATIHAASAVWPACSRAVSWLQDKGRDARVIETRFEGEQDEVEEAE